MIYVFATNAISMDPPIPKPKKEKKNCEPNKHNPSTTIYHKKDKWRGVFAYFFFVGDSIFHFCLIGSIISSANKKNGSEMFCCRYELSHALRLLFPEPSQETKKQKKNLSTREDHGHVDIHSYDRTALFF
jgi:hypothetical protein